MTKTKINKVCFYITGDAFTDTARDVWLSDMPGHAMRICLEGLIGCPAHIAIKILTGKQKVVGDSRNKDLHNEKDNTKGLYTVDQMKTRIQEKLNRIGVDIQFYLATIWGSNYSDILNYPTGDIMEEREHLCKLIANCIKQYNKARDDMKTFYELAELPINEFNRNYPALFSEQQFYKSVKDTQDEMEVLYEKEQEIKREIQGGCTDEEMAEAKANFLNNFDTTAYLQNQKEMMDLVDIDMSHSEMINERMSEDHYWKIIEENNCQPVPVDDITWKSGYLDRNGNFYPCPMIQHMSLANRLQDHGIIPSNIEDPEKWCDDYNWVKISINRVLYYGNKPPTKSQFKALYKYFDARKLSKVKVNMDKVDICNIEDVLKEK